MSFSQVCSLPAFLDIVAKELRPHDAIFTLGSAACVAKIHDIQHYYEILSRRIAADVPTKADKSVKYADLRKVASFFGLSCSNYPTKSTILDAIASYTDGKPNNVPPTVWHLAQAMRDAKARMNGEPTSGRARCYYFHFDDIEGPLVTATDAHTKLFLTDDELDTLETHHYVNRYGTPARMFILEQATALSYEKHGGLLGLMIRRELVAMKHQMRLDEKTRRDELARKRRDNYEINERKRREDEIRGALGQIQETDVETCITRWLTITKYAQDASAHPPYWWPANAIASSLHRYTTAKEALGRIDIEYDAVIWRDFVMNNGDPDNFGRCLKISEERHFLEHYARIDAAKKMTFNLRREKIDFLANLWRSSGGLDTGDNGSLAARVIAIRDFEHIAGAQRALEIVPAHLRSILKISNSDIRTLKRKRDM